MLPRLLLRGRNFVSACLIRLDVRFWHLADVDAALRMSALRGKADIATRLQMSANDPKQTSLSGGDSLRRARKLSPLSVIGSDMAFPR